MMMLNSYSSNNGTVTIIWEMISGGVIKAASVINPKYAYFRYLLINIGVMTPRRVKNSISTGSWKTMPKGSVIWNRNWKYSLIPIVSWISRLSDMLSINPMT